MLNIWICDREGNRKKESLKDVNNYFNFNKKRDWFNDDVVKKIIKDIDDTIAVKDEYLESPVFGGMSPDRLSGGCKAVILLYVKEDINIYATKCGDNCVESILRIADMKDITITLNHIMRFPEKFTANILNTGRVINTYKEFLREYDIAKGYREGI